MATPIQSASMHGQENFESDSSSNGPAYEPDSDSGSVSVSSAEAESEVEGPHERGRKRTRTPNIWQTNERKRLRNTGEAYQTKKRKAIPKKTIRLLPNHRCKQNCHEITEAQQKVLFKKFWELGDFNQQNAYICGTVQAVPTAQHRGRKDPQVSRRKFSRRYLLTTPLGTVRVCKAYFLATFDISNGRVGRSLKKQLTPGNGIPTPDRRGKHANHRSVSKQVIQKIKNHITSFPSYESHYTRERQTTRKYLSPDLTVSKMYHLYVQQCEEKGEQPQKIWIYRRIFNTNFNLAFHHPRTDTCKTCDIMKMKVEAADSDEQKRKLEAELELHHRKAEKVRKSMSMEKEKTNQDQTYSAFTFDLQKTLPTPHLTTGIVYYKRQLWTYNLGVHSLHDNSASMYMWHEGIAKRGPNEIGSCVYHYVKRLSEKGVTKITAYSDACGGQNRNIKMALFWSHIVATLPITEINHKFMVSGHSYLPNDQDFGVIEKKKYGLQLYVPSMWMELVSIARRINPFKVVKMTNADFFNTDAMADYTVNRKKCTDGHDVKWLKIQRISFKKEAPLKMLLSHNADDDAPFYELDLARKTKGRPRDVTNIVLPQLYSTQICINPLKLKDLLNLLDLVPPIHHNFYRNLTSDNDAELYNPDIEDSDSEYEVD